MKLFFKCCDKSEFSIHRDKDGLKTLVCSCGNITNIFLLIDPKKDSTVIWKNDEAGES